MRPMSIVVSPRGQVLAEATAGAVATWTSPSTWPKPGQLLFTFSLI
jgi:hypothetical protein